MKYARVLLTVSNEVWAMEPVKMQAVIDLLRFQAMGGKYSAEEIQAKINKTEERAVARQDGSVAILPLRGVISNRMAMLDDVSGGGGTSSESFGRSFNAALNDPSVKAIVIDTDSPGGAVSGTDELSSMIFNARGTKPIVAHVNANAASAAYWIATAADEIVVTPSGQVGSIGVYGAHDDISKAMEMDGIKTTLISAGKFKVEGNPFEPLSDDAREAIQQRVDASYDSFTRAVARNRGVAISAVKGGFGQGRMVDAEDAVSQGMADRVGTLDETLQRFGASLYAPAPQKTRAFAPERERRALNLNHGF